MKAVETLLQQVHDLGASIRLAGGRIIVEGPSPLPGVLMEELRQQKAEVTAHLTAESQMVSFDLPFPIGYGGLPQAQVEACKAVTDRFGITDPIHRKYNVIAWVRGYYQDRGENHGDHYEAIKREQQRLGRLLDEESNS